MSPEKNVTAAGGVTACLKRLRAAASRAGPGSGGGWLPVSHERLAELPAELRAFPAWVLSGPYADPSKPGSRAAKPPLAGRPLTCRGSDGETIWHLPLARFDDPYTMVNFRKAADCFMGYYGREVRVRIGGEDRLITVSCLGVVLTPAMGVIGIDVDNALDHETGETAKWAAPLLDALLRAGTYVEFSPSGTGFHAFLKGDLPKGAARERSNGVELFTAGQYLACTGNRISETSDIAGGAAAEEALGVLLDRMNGTSSASQAVPAPAGKPANVLEAPVDAAGTTAAAPGTAAGTRSVTATTGVPAPAGAPATPAAATAVSAFASTASAGASAAYSSASDVPDAELLEKAFSEPRTGPALRRWFEEGCGAGDDRSARDMWAAGRLAWWTNRDRERVVRLMKSSAAGRDPARAAIWDSRRGNATWLEQTVDRALAAFVGRGYLDQGKPREEPEVVVLHPEDPQSEKDLCVVRKTGEPPPFRVPVAKGLPKLPSPGDGTPVIPYGTNFLEAGVFHWNGEVSRAICWSVRGRVIFRGGAICRVRVDTKAAVPGAEDAISVCPVRLDEFAGIIDECTAGVRLSTKGKPSWTYSFPDTGQVSRILGNSNPPCIGKVKDIARLPVLDWSAGDRSYRIIDEPGLDERTGLCLVFRRDNYPFADFDWYRTPDGLREAYGLISRVLREFPFASLPSRAAAVAAMLSTVVRPVIDTCPMFAITAPVAGTGKTQLASVMYILGEGSKDVSVLSWADNQEEFAKLMLSKLLKGSQVTILDNIPPGTVLRNPAFEAALTSPLYEGRKLGESRTLQVSTRSLYIATGNNLQITGDMIRRTILIELNRRGEERPDKHRFEEEGLNGFVLENRGTLIVGMLAILAAYIDAGMPVLRKGARGIGGFRIWNDLVRNATVWLLVNMEGIAPEEADPAVTQDRMAEADPVRDATVQFFKALEAAYPPTEYDRKQGRTTRRFPASDFEWDRIPNEADRQADPVRADLYDTFVQAHDRGGRPTSRKASQLFRSIRGTNFGGRSKQYTRINGRGQWYLEQCGGAAGAAGAGGEAAGFLPGGDTPR